MHPLLANVTDRRGWRQEWDQFDPDVKDEIESDFRAHDRNLRREVWEMAARLAGRYSTLAEQHIRVLAGAEEEKI